MEKKDSGLVSKIQEHIEEHKKHFHYNSKNLAAVVFGGGMSIVVCTTIGYCVGGEIAGLMNKSSMYIDSGKEYGLYAGIGAGIIGAGFIAYYLLWD